MRLPCDPAPEYDSRVVRAGRSGWYCCKDNAFNFGPQCKVCGHKRCDKKREQQEARERERESEGVVMVKRTLETKRMVPTSTVEKVVVRGQEKAAAKQSASAAKPKGDAFEGFRPEEGEATTPVWSDIHGLRDSGFDGEVLIASELAQQIKALEEQLAEVKLVLMERMRGCVAAVRVEDITGVPGSRVEYSEPKPYLGSPKREKLVQLGVAPDVIEKACDVVKPKPFVKIVLPAPKKQKGE